MCAVFMLITNSKVVNSFVEWPDSDFEILSCKISVAFDFNQDILFLGQKISIQIKNQKSKIPWMSHFIFGVGMHIPH